MKRGMKMIVFSLPDDDDSAQILARNLDAEMGKAIVRRFPDGESYICIESSVKEKTVIVLAVLREPDAKMLPLIFLAATLRDLGAKRIILVAPYLPYMRQDRRFREGEGITSVYFAGLISEWFDALITIDPHLHRRKSLDEIYPIPGFVLHAAPLVSNWIRKNIKKPLLIGPDGESEQWVKSVAEAAAAPYIVLEKVRRGDRDVEVSLPQIEKWNERTPILVDDIISTAKTMIKTVGHLKDLKFNPPVCIGIHAVFADNAYADLLEAGVEKIVTCNTISHESNDIDVLGLVADFIKKQKY